MLCSPGAKSAPTSSSPSPISPGSSQEGSASANSGGPSASSSGRPSRRARSCKALKAHAPPTPHSSSSCVCVCVCGQERRGRSAFAPVPRHASELPATRWDHPHLADVAPTRQELVALSRCARSRLQREARPYNLRERGATQKGYTGINPGQATHECSRRPVRAAYSAGSPQPKFRKIAGDWTREAPSVATWALRRGTWTKRGPESRLESRRQHWLHQRLAPPTPKQRCCGAGSRISWSRATRPNPLQVLRKLMVDLMPPTTLAPPRIKIALSPLSPPGPPPQSADSPTHVRRRRLMSGQLDGASLRSITSRRSQVIEHSAWLRRSVVQPMWHIAGTSGYLSRPDVHGLSRDGGGRKGEAVQHC